MWDVHCELVRFSFLLKPQCALLGAVFVSRIPQSGGFIQGLRVTSTFDTPSPHPVSMSFTITRHMNSQKKALLVEAVRAQPVLWNVHDQTYQKNRNKCHIWSDIERLLQINEPLYSGLKAKECWRYLRKKYFEEKVRLASNSLATPSFTLYPQLTFLDSASNSRLDCNRNSVEQSSSTVAAGANNQWASSINADTKSNSAFASARDNVINVEAVAIEHIIPELLALATRHSTEEHTTHCALPPISLDEMTDCLSRSACALERMSDMFRRLHADRNFLFLMNVLEELNALSPLRQAELKLAIQKAISRTKAKDGSLSPSSVVSSLNV
ncbi:hypothetical protein L596_003156 [Steinernema carpocapsae]|uniref:MADF domain-containing protein n=1 Tax=Steinernema carpocapsae TaxID=34508 RepID=A0A4V6I7W7_STECR|nr:hypothetical protein L596_003156 [Steinernema carpocapsae]